MQLKDLVFISAMATLMAVITDLLYPIAVIIGGPILGPSLVHHALFAIPLALILSIVHCKVPHKWTYSIFSLIWGFLMFVRLGNPIPIVGFWSAGIVSDSFALLFRFFKVDKKRFFLSLQSGIFLFSLGMFMSVLFGIFLGSVGQKLILKNIGLFAIVILIPASITAASGYLLNPIVVELKNIGLLDNV
ncbi:MAG: hypothetical protein ACP5RX_02180 [Minisyncoccia bacterium]